MLKTFLYAAEAVLVATLGVAVISESPVMYGQTQSQIAEAALMGLMLIIATELWQLMNSRLFPAAR
jgi:hypothetical protein